MIKYITTFFKGIAMGAADVVPGVSGGTIAFISGIYEELINSIKSIDRVALGMLARLRFGEFWRRINGNFLGSLVLGIAVSIFSLAKVMTYLLVTYPIGVWSFFFGLIIASSLLVSRKIGKWNGAAVIALICGAAAAYFITTVSPATTPETWWFIILCGAVAICAMILPGISGAFILLLMGKYQFMMTAVSELRIGTIMLFVVGAVAGIVSFSNLLSWLLKSYRNTTMAVLTGFMLGSLNKVWPWKQTIQTYVDSHGKLQPLVERNVLPGTYGEITGTDPILWQAIALCVAGFLTIYLIETVATRISSNRENQ